MILFPYHVVDENLVLYTRPELEQRFPLAWLYLNDARELLKSREDGRWNVEQWWQFGRNQNIAEMAMPKILNQVLASKSSFAYDPNGQYCFVGGGNAGGYGLRVKSNIGFSDHYILGILNSNVADYFVKQTSTPFRGGFFSYAKRFIKNIPIPTPSANLRERIAAVARACLDAAKDHPDRLPALESELNALVYQAYGLDEGDVRVIEGSVGKTAHSAQGDGGDLNEDGA